MNTVGCVFQTVRTWCYNRALVLVLALLFPSSLLAIEHCPSSTTSVAASKSVTKETLIYPSFYFGTTKADNHYIAYQLYQEGSPTGLACWTETNRGQLSEYYSPFEVLITPELIDPDYFNNNSKNDILHLDDEALLNEIGELHFKEDYQYNLTCSVDDRSKNDYFCGITTAVYDIYKPTHAPVVVGIIHRSSSKK